MALFDQVTNGDVISHLDRGWQQLKSQLCRDLESEGEGTGEAQEESFVKLREGFRVLFAGFPSPQPPARRTS